MVTNSAVLAALFLFLAVFWLGGETTFLAPYRRLLFREHGVQLAGLLLILFLNLFALFYGLSRVLFLKDTGIKLHHLDRQLSTRDTVLTDLTRRIDE
jgi:uncharacterized membrane protein YciS (DUF1049 family)